MAEPEAKPEPKEVEENAEPPLTYKVDSSQFLQILFLLLTLARCLDFLDALCNSFRCCCSVSQKWTLKVSIHCEACKRKVKRVLKDVEGWFRSFVSLIFLVPLFVSHFVFLSVLRLHLRFSVNWKKFWCFCNGDFSNLPPLYLSLELVMSYFLAYSFLSNFIYAINGVSKNLNSFSL